MTTLAGWEQIAAGNNGGPFTTERRVLVLHTTEGNTVDDAVAAYRHSNSWPHCTVDPRTGRRAQHLPLDVAARSLENHAGGVETNRAGAIQVEIVGRAHDAHAWPAAWLDWLGADVVRPLRDATGFALAAPYRFYDDRAGFTVASYTARQRLSGGAWMAAQGIVGHQHVPENAHWDPGAPDVARIIAAAKGGQDQEDDMTPEQEHKLDQALLYAAGAAECSQQAIAAARVSAAYFTALGRPVDLEGLANGINQLTKGGETPEQFVASLQRSSEGKQWAAEQEAKKRAAQTAAKK